MNTVNGKSSSTNKTQLKKYFWIFLLPSLISFVVIFLWPFIHGLILSFYKFKTLKFKEFAGFSNYISAFSDVDFLRSFFLTLAYTIVTVIVINVTSLFLAILLTSKVRGSTFFRTIFFMPNLVGGIVLAYVFKALLNEIVEQLFDSQLLLNAQYGFWGLVIILAWQQIGYMMVIYIAGISNVPQEMLEAAQIDGAGRIQTFKNVTLPMIAPTITICLFLTITNSFKLFDQNLALTGGLPENKTTLLALNIYRSFYQSSTNMGIGQAKAVIFLIVVAMLSLLQVRLTRKKEVEL